MVVSRLAKINQQNSLYYRAKALVERLHARKGAQNVGADAVRYRPSTTTAVYDLTVPPRGGAPYGYAYKTMRFTAATVNVVAGGWRFMVYRGSVTTIAAKGDFRIEQQDLNFTELNNRLRCGINAYNYTNETLYIKAYAFATDSGVVVME